MKLEIFDKDNAIPFSKVTENFKRGHHFTCTTLDFKLRGTQSEKEFKIFERELEDLMLKYKISSVAASLYAKI